DACPTVRFMESCHGRSVAPWDDEPTPNPSPEGNSRGADGRLLPSWEGSWVGRLHGKTGFTLTGCEVSLWPVFHKSSAGRGERGLSPLAASRRLPHVVAGERAAPKRVTFRQQDRG